MFYTYVLRSLKNNRKYIGSTNNLERRLQEHNNGQSKYTSLTRPFELIHSENFYTRKEAIKRELYLKSGQGRTWLKENFG
jgi:putative endonuclease